MRYKQALMGFESFAKTVFKNLDAPSDTLLDAVKYSFFSGGKRIRARFVYAIGEAFDIDILNCHKLAFSIEAIHTYSLIHDDLPAMDDDVIRRGKPTCHIKYDESTAILAGDALQSLAFAVIHDLDVISMSQFKSILKIFSECCGISGMVGGQRSGRMNQNGPQLKRTVFDL